MIRIGQVMVPFAQVAWVEDRGRTGVLHLVDGVTIRGRRAMEVPADDWPSVRDRIERGGAPEPRERPGRRVSTPPC